MAVERQPHNLTDQVAFLSDLIQTGPLYIAGERQRECATVIADQLDRFGWELETQPYQAGQLRDDWRYVPVASFGGQYANDENRPKQNIIASIEASKPGKTLILNGHYDVEPVLDADQWDRSWSSGDISMGRVWGRGASDMLGGLTSQLFVASRLASDRDSWRGKIVFTAVADEEIGGNGTLAALQKLKHEGVLEDGPEVSCLIAEPSESIIALESLGFLHMRLRALGRAQHMGAITARDNILYDLLDEIEHFDATLDIARSSVNPSAPRLKHIFGLITGGIDAATPMPDVSAEATIHYPVDTPVEALKAAITDAVADRSDMGIETTFSDFYFDGQRSSLGELHEALSATRPDAAILTSGIFPSPCDARLFTQFGVKNVVTYGPGSLAQAHCANEFIAIQDIARYNQHLEAALRHYMI